MSDEMCVRITRRGFVHAAAAGLALPALGNARSARPPINGVRIGVQTYSFRALPRKPGSDASDAIIEAMNACGLDECELWSPQLEPAPPSAAASADERERFRETLRQWRLQTPIDRFAALRKKFASAGVAIYAYNLSFNESFTDEEIDRGFEHARALGAEVITASTTLSVARRVAPFANRHRFPVAMHNHSQRDNPNEFATPESFTTALEMSPQFRVNLDIGHFTAADFDALSFIERHHAQITNLHLKDRRKGQGPNVPWGEGDTPIREVLVWLKRRRSPIRAYIEYEYEGPGSPIEEVSACLAYVKKALA